MLGPRADGKGERKRKGERVSDGWNGWGGGVEG